MNRKTALILSTVALGFALAAGTAVASTEIAKGAEAAVEPRTYELYTSDELVSVKNGKKFTMAQADEAIIKRSDGGRETTDTSLVSVYRADGTPQLNNWKDTEYAYNAGNIGETPEDTVMYQMLGNSEVFFEGYTGGEIGAEWILSEEIDAQEYFALSFDVAYGYFGTAPETAALGDTVGESYLYVYGTGKDGNTLVQAQKVSFGIDYYSTGVLEFGEEFSTISRIAVSVLSQTVTNQEDSRYLVVTGFTVHAKEPTATEKVFTANGMDLDFYNGNSIFGAFGGKSTRVFWANGPYAGNFAVTGEDYCYGTQRIATGSFVTLKLKDPVKVSDYQYMDIDLYVLATGAEGDWLNETSERFYISVLRNDATDLQTETTFELKRSQWATCRVPLADFADENGYVNSLVFYYADNDSHRSAEESGKYAIHFGLNNAVLTNHVDKEMLVYYIESPKVSETQVSMQLKTSYFFAYTDEPTDEFADGISVNGKSLKNLLAENKATLDFDGNYVCLSVEKALFRMDDTDKVEIQKGVKVCGELLVKEREIFTYYATLDRFELEADENAERKSQIGLEQVEMGTVDEQYDMTGGGYTVAENSIFVTFSYPVCLNWKASRMHASMDKMSLLTGSSEDYVYELAKQGVIKSCLDLLYVNGKSIRDWLRIDREAGLEGLIYVEFLGDGFNWGKTLRVMAAKESNLKLGVGLDMSIEFKSGFVTPMNQYVDKDMYCSISAENAVGVNSLFAISDETEREVIDAEGSYQNPNAETGCNQGCSGALTVGKASGFAVFIFGATLLFVKRKRESGK